MIVSIDELQAIRELVEPVGFYKVVNCKLNKYSIRMSVDSTYSCSVKIKNNEVKTTFNILAGDLAKIVDKERFEGPILNIEVVKDGLQVGESREYQRFCTFIPFVIDTDNSKGQIKGKRKRKIKAIRDWNAREDIQI